MNPRFVIALALALGFLTALALGRGGAAPARAEIIGNPQSRYVLVPVQAIRHDDLGSAQANSVIKLDSVTGETWVLHPQGWKPIKSLK